MKQYTKNKRLLIKLLGTVRLPSGLNKNERRRQLKKGVLPRRYNCHHCLPRSQGGSDKLENLSIIEVPKHDKLHRDLEKTDIARPGLKTFAREHGAMTVEDARTLLQPGGRMDYNR